MSFIILLLLTTPLLASVPLLPFEDKLNTEFKKNVSNIPSRIDDLYVKNKSSQYQLQRFDLDVSISAELGVLLFSKETEKAVELVWERKKNSISEEETQEIEIGISVKETANQMLPYVIEVLSDLNASNKIRKKAIAKVYRDARRLTRYVQALQTFNGKEEWQVANYFKNYYFSASGQILGNGIEYDKRLRFRFRTPSPIVLATLNTRFEKRIHRRLTRMARHFLAVQALDRPEHRFTMNRVRSVDGLGVSIDFGFGEISASKGILLEWLPSSKSHFVSKFMPVHTPGYLRRLTNIIETNVPDTNNFILSQIRIKGSIESELIFLFLSFNKFREIEYHYRIKQ